MSGFCLFFAKVAKTAKDCQRSKMANPSAIFGRQVRPADHLAEIVNGGGIPVRATLADCATQSKLSSQA
jgi:hypothetical protein